MKEMKRHGRRSDMRNAGALIQFAVGDELHPEGDWIVIKAHEANIALIELGLVESVLSGKIQPLALHAPPQQFREIEYFPRNRASRKCTLIVDIEQCDQNHKERVLRADEPSCIEELALGLFLRARAPGGPVRELRTQSEYACPAD